MSSVLLRTPETTGWRLHIVSPRLRGTALAGAAIGTGILMIGVLRRSEAGLLTESVVALTLAWCATAFAPVWNRQVVKPMFDRFAPGEDGSRRGFYAFFELFFLLALVWIVLWKLLQVWGSGA